MPFFPFGRKTEFARDYAFEEIPVFSSLSLADQKVVEKKARLIEYKRGDLVYEEGIEPDAFYVVISGRFRLFHPGRDQKTLLYFHRGDHFSEVSLLTNRPHSASVEAKRDGVLLKIEKDDFLKLVKDHPSISLFLNRSLGHRLTKVEAAANHQEIKVATLFSLSGSAGAVQTWIDFAAALHEQTHRRVILVDFTSPISPFLQREFPSRKPASFVLDSMEPSRDSDLRAAAMDHPKGFHYLHVALGSGSVEERKLAALLTFLTYKHDYILLKTTGSDNPFLARALKHSDVAYAFTMGTEIPEMASAIKTFQEQHGFSKNELRILIPEQPDNAGMSFEAKEEGLQTRIFSLIPCREETGRYALNLRYLAKEFAGTLLGLALGSGAAYGLAHIGVLKVMEEEGILPDVISGSSIGALVGAFWAAGYSAEELHRVARTIDLKTGFFRLLGFQDMSIAHRGFFKGNQVVRWLESHLGQQTFQDLRIPLKIIAADLFTSEEVIMDTGKISDAVRASVSIPGIFRPVLHRGRYLIDGGVVDALPVRVLASMGIKKILAVNVLPGPQERIERNRLQEEAARQRMEQIAQKGIWGRFWGRGKDKVYHRYADNIFNVIMSTIQFLEYEAAQTWGKQADILLNPIVPDAHWAEFYSSDKFVRIGEEKTREQLVEIKKLLVE